MQIERGKAANFRNEARLKQILRHTNFFLLFQVSCNTKFHFLCVVQMEGKISMRHSIPYIFYIETIKFHTFFNCRSEYFNSAKLSSLSLFICLVGATPQPR